METKKIIPLLLLFYSSFVFSQSLQVQNAIMYLKEKNYEKAKLNADASVEMDKTKNLAKAWLYRGQVYQAIFQDTSKKVNQLDEEAQEKSVTSFVKSAQLDKDNIYKNDIKAGLSISAGSLLNKVEGFYISTKQYEKALAGSEILKTAIPFDSDELLKRRNITPENLMYIQYRIYYAANTDISKTIEAGNKLMAINFKIPNIYSSMAKLSLSQKDTVAALSCLDKGLALFDNNLDLLTMQIDILLAQKKNDILIQKLESAIELSPDNDVLHAVLANLYEKLNNTDKAEKEYLKTIDLNPKNEYALFNLGNLYFIQGNEWNKKLNNLPPKETAKAKEYEAKSDEFFKKAVVYFEQYYQIKPDAAVKQRLRQIFARLGETEKAEKYK
jgi:tetratricopeptide (TPR) repeat protein